MVNWKNSIGTTTAIRLTVFVHDDLKLYVDIILICYPTIVVSAFFDVSETYGEANLGIIVSFNLSLYDFIGDLKVGKVRTS